MWRLTEPGKEMLSTSTSWLERFQSNWMQVTISLLLYRYLFSVMTCQVRLCKVGSRLSFWLWPGNTCECDVLVRAARWPIPFCSNNIPPVNPRLIFLNFNGHRKFMMNKLCDAQSISQTSPPSDTLSYIFPSPEHWIG